MANYIAVPLKKTNEVDLIKPLKHIFADFCSQTDEPNKYDDAIGELNKLRRDSTWRTLDKHESSLDVMTRYYDQLNLLDAKCPSVDFQVPFKWRDAFDKGSFFLGTSSLTLTSLLFEKVSLLFNIGAMQSQIAVNCVSEMNTDEGLKQAAKYFQMSSGSFQQVKAIVIQMNQDPTPDLQPETVMALQALMLAQAQETFLHKAIADDMKEIIIAKVASQCEDLYADALKLMQKESTRVIFEKEWLSLVAGKQTAFHAVAQYYQACVCGIKKEFGEQIARLKHAGELIKLAEARGGITFPTNLKEYNNKITYAYNEAKKDNDFIYHARIPDVKSLAPIGKAPLAKPTPIGEKLNPNSKDLFTDLLPLPVQHALQTFDVKKAEMIAAEKTKMQSQTQLLNGILASLNLPAALEDVTGDSLPQSLQEKAQAVRDSGGMAGLERTMNELPALVQRNRELLDESDRMLNDEEESDANLRSQFRDKWHRTPSTRLNQALKSNIQKYRQFMSNATNADTTVRDKFNAHKEAMELLCLSEEELLSRIPKGNPVTNSSSAEQLRTLMQQVKELVAEREQLKEELENTTVDMKTKFLSALTMDGSVNEQALSVETIGKIYGPTQKRIRENLEEQEKLVQEIQLVNTEFCKEKDANYSAAQRETKLSELAAAHDVYMELRGNLEEGTKFYNNLTEMLVAFQNKIGDFCFARKTEKDDLCKELQKNIVSQASNQPTPVAPSHHSTAEAKKSPPARPPPPTSSSNMPPYTAPSWDPSRPPQADGAAHNPASIPPGNIPPYPTYPVFPYPTMPMAYPPYGTYPPATSYVPPPQGQYPPSSNYPYPQQQYYQQWPHQ